MRINNVKYSIFFSAAYLDPVTENNKEQIFDISILVSILELIRIIHIHVKIFFELSRVHLLAGCTDVKIDTYYSYSYSYSCQNIIPSEDGRQVVLMSCQGVGYHKKGYPKQRPKKLIRPQ